MVISRRGKDRVRQCVLRMPFVGHFLRIGYQRLQIALARFRAVRFRIMHPSLPDPDQVFWIDPLKIVRHTNYTRTSQTLGLEDHVFDTVKDKGKVYGGEWDNSTFKFADLSVYKAIEDRMLRNRSWPESGFYQSLSRSMSADSPWGIRSQADLDKRFRYIDRLIESIKAKGFKCAHEAILGGETRNLKHHVKYGNFVTVNISRTGELLFQDGRHRLAIAQILRLPKIPVKFLVRHSEWVTIRAQFCKSQSIDKVLAYGIGESLSELHPDLQDVLKEL